MEIATGLMILFFIYLKINRQSALNFILPLKKIPEDMFGNLEKAILVKIFFLSLASSILTLIYSEIFLQIPCALCWWQRVFMYGIVVISATALWSDRMGNKGPEIKGILKYILNFSVLGFLFALYQHIMQIAAFYGTHLPCPVSGEDCAKMTIFEYGHITFPLMAVVLFMHFIISVLIVRDIQKPTVQ